MASESRDVFHRRTFCLVTGASKGFGRCIALQFASRFPAGSVMLLMARSAEKLEEVRSEITSKYAHIHVVISPADLACVAGSDMVFRDVVTNALKSSEGLDQALIVHNAGSLGDISKNMVEHGDPTHLSSYWGLNLTSVVTLNSVFFDTFNKNTAVKHRFAINISSICALQPFRSWSLYCAGKAARDMLFRTMAQEEKDIRVLNYAPGPINTDMQLGARTMTGDKEIKKMFADLHSDGKLLSCEESVAKLVKLLTINNFDSGAHIDFFDL